MSLRIFLQRASNVNNDVNVAVFGPYGVVLGHVVEADEHDGDDGRHQDHEKDNRDQRPVNLDEHVKMTRATIVKCVFVDCSQIFLLPIMPLQVLFNKYIVIGLSTL